MLVREEILRKAPHPDDRCKEIFLLTDKGFDLIPVLLQIEAWSGLHDSKSDLAPAFAIRIKNNLADFAAQVRSAVEAKQAATCVTVGTS